MTTVWVFLIIMNGHIQQVGGFTNEVDCENTRNEVIVQRTEIGYGNSSLRPYILSKHFETTKCFKVWK